MKSNSIKTLKDKLKHVKGEEAKRSVEDRIEKIANRKMVTK